MLKLSSPTRATRGSSVLLLALMAGIVPAAATPFTCGTFKDRLGEALVEAADPGTEAPAYKETRATDGGGSHANWDTALLSGSLTCGADDRFGEFYVSLNVTSRERFVEQLKRLVTLDGAAICTLAQTTPAVCADAGKVLLQDALGKMGGGASRQNNNPSGVSDRMLWPDVKAELTAAPSLITFSLGADNGAVPATERRSLQVLPPLLSGSSAKTP